MGEPCQKKEVAGRQACLGAGTRLEEGALVRVQLGWVAGRLQHQLSQFGAGALPAQREHERGEVDSGQPVATRVLPVDEASDCATTSVEQHVSGRQIAMDPRDVDSPSEQSHSQLLGQGSRASPECRRRPAGGRGHDLQRTAHPAVEQFLVDLRLPRRLNVQLRDERSEGP